jgi:hypothetical protein
MRQFGQLMATLSEPEGYFDSDNFVSNEAAYLRIIPALGRLGVTGGAYLGVGPDQNYSYIAEIHPDLAFIIDIRRQNALQHLYYKALFQLSANRAEFISRLFGRALDITPDFALLSIAELLGAIDKAAPDPAFQADRLAEAVQLVQAWELGLSNEDLNAIRYIARAFMMRGPDLKFTSYNRAPRPHHPSYRTLMLEKDSNGAQANYLAAEERFQIVKRLHRDNRIIPLVGDFGGAGAMQRAGQEVRRRGLQVTCFYVSNVEFYLFRGERWSSYIANLRSLPWARDAYFIRSYANMWQPHPSQRAGYYMSTLMQSVHAFLTNESAGRNATYWDVVTQDCIVR